MGEIVNLRRVRRRKERDGDAQAAAENRVRFGRTRGEVAADAATGDRAARVLDGARMERPDPAAGQTGGDAAAKRAKDRDTVS